MKTLRVRYMRQGAPALSIIRLNNWEAGFETRSVGLQSLRADMVGVIFPVQLLEARLAALCPFNQSTLYWVNIVL